MNRTRGRGTGGDEEWGQYNGNRGNYNSRGGNNRARGSYRGSYDNGPRRNDNYNNRPYQRRDTEADLLSLINSDFQINCTDYRSIDDIFHRIRQDNELFNYIKGDKTNLEKFLVYYSNNFLLDPNRPGIVQWRKDQRLYAKNDRKEPKREERRKWAKEYDEQNIWFDVVHEQNVLRFILSLFLSTKETWLRLDLVQKAVKQALRSEADLDDYVGGDVRSFVSKRDYLFKEHMDMLLFHGVNTADVVYLLNEEVRENSYQANNRVPFRRLHKFYLESPNITNNARQELNLDEPKNFLDFLKRATWVFTTDDDDTHVISKRTLPSLPWGRPLDRHLKEIVDIFKTMHRQEERGDDDVASIDVDDLDEIYSKNGGASGKSRKKRVQSSLSDRSVTHSLNPFVAKVAQANGHRPELAGEAVASASAHPPLDDLSDFLNDHLELDDNSSSMGDNPWSKYK